MSILSDNQIKALCIPPETYFDNEKYLSWIKQPHTVIAPLGGPDAVSAYWEEVKKTFERPSTQEEKDSFIPMISPYVSESVRELTNEFSGLKDKYKILSFGSSSYGYDVRLDYQFKIFTNVNGSEIDPRNISNDCLVDGVLKHTDDGASYVILPPNSYLLGVTIEYFVMPRDVLGVFVGKSTMARCGAIVNVTPIEPGFIGKIVVEISNATSLPMRIYAGQGIAQCLFFKGDEACKTSYADRLGKYCGQTGITLAKV